MESMQDIETACIDIEITCVKEAQPCHTSWLEVMSHQYVP